MKFKLISLEEYKKNLNNHNSICYGIFKNENDINIISNKEYILNLIHREFLINDLGNYFIIYDIPNSNIKQLLIIGCGDKKEFEDYEYKIIVKKYINILKKINTNYNTCFLTSLPVKNKDNEWKLKVTIKIIRDEIYSFSKFISKKNNIIKNINLIVEDNNLYKLKEIVYQSEIISDASDISKNLGNLPANICNSNFIHNECIKLCENNNNIEYEYITKDKMKEIGMNSYLSVSLGSNSDPIMSILKYKSNDSNTINKDPIIFIGKGLTFDTGGISLKQSKDMDEMKFDMCGAATVYSIIYAANKLNLPINIIGILATCENSIDGKSLRPGDIITSLSGKTIEVLNTDAEGRLVLCDAIYYSYKFNPSIIIDIATLTGACSIALGKHFGGLISNDINLVKDIINSSNKSDDKVWELPLIKENQDQIKSNIADIKNIGDGEAGTITAACFLYNFIKKGSSWAHLDIASIAYKNKMSTGRPIYLLMQFLIDKL